MVKGLGFLTASVAALLLLGVGTGRLIADPEYIYAMHDPGGEHHMAEKGTKGWIVFTEAIGHNPSDQSGVDYSSYANAGYGVIVRLNNGYGSDGTLPYEAEYDNFAQRCANFVSHSPGVSYWIIGNECNLPREWPGNVNGDENTGEPITVARYVSCYNKCYTKIQAVAPGALICPAPSGTWAPPYSQIGGLGFIDYWVSILNGIGASKIGGLAIHSYTHGCDPALVTDQTKMGPPYQNYYYNFQVYRNYMAAIPASMRTKPVFITECDQNVECADPPPEPRHTWLNSNNGWVRAIYQEINNWNASNSQKIRCVALFRWWDVPEGQWNFGIQYRQGVIDDWRAAMDYRYKWTTPGPSDTTPPTISSIVPSSSCIKTGSLITVTANVTDNVAISQSGINLTMPTNLLVNPSFENGLTGWTNSSSPPYIIGNNYPHPGTAKDGANWAGTSCGYSSGIKSPELRQVVNVTPGSKYYLSVWVNTQSSPNPCSAYLQWKDGIATGDGQCTTIASFAANTSGWKQLYGVVTPTGSQMTMTLKLTWDCSGAGGGGNFDLAEVRAAPNPNSYSSGVATWNNVQVTSGYTFQVFARDDAGNVNLGTSAIPVVIDDFPPNDFTPIATPSGWTSGNVTVSFSTTDVGCAGLNHYEVAIDGGSYFSQSSPYTMTQPGIHTIHVKAVDSAGNFRVKDVNTYIDVTPPATPIVTDDGMYTPSTTELHASWTANDGESGVAEYLYAVGSAPGSTDIVGWTSAGELTSVTVGPLSLSYDQTCYFGVKARNNAGLWSSIGGSDGITVARTLPSISAAHAYPDNSAVILADKSVSAKIGSAFWIQETDRSAGMKVTDSANVSPGMRVTVGGRLATIAGERALFQAEVAQLSTDSAPAPIGMRSTDLGGASPSAFTPGIKDGLGPYNVGLLVRVWGKVTACGTDYFYIDDGAGLIDGTATNQVPNVGIRVLAAPGELAPGDFVLITGVSTAFAYQNSYLRAVLPITGGILRL